MNRSPIRRKARGMTLIEVTVALIVITVAFGVVSGFVMRYIDGQKEKAAAAYLQNVAEAAQAYIADNHATLRSTATATNAAVVTHAQLLAGKYLPAGTAATTPHGLSYTVRVIEPTAGRLEGIVRTQGNSNLKGMELRRIAGGIGVMGGYVEGSGSAAVAQGAHGAWSRSLSPWGGSPNANQLVVALFMSELADNDDFLHRSATAGRPELNRMATDLNMGGHDVDGVGDLTASGTVHALAVNGRLTHNSGYFDLGSYSTSSYGAGSARMWWNANSGELSLQNTRGGRGNLVLGGIAANAAITTSSTLSASGNITTGGTLFGSVLDVDNAYNDGWYRTRGQTGWYSQTYGGGWHMTDSSWVRSYNGKNVYSSGQLRGGSLYAENSVQAGGNVTASGAVTAARLDSTLDVVAGRNVTAGERVTGLYLLPQGTASCNASCPTNGLIGRTTAGQAASCVSGTWRCLTFSTGGTNPDPGPGPSPTQGCLPDYPPTGCPYGWSPNPGGGCKNDRTGQLMVCP